MNEHLAKIAKIAKTIDDLESVINVCEVEQVNANEEICDLEMQYSDILDQINLLLPIELYAESCYGPIDECVIYFEKSLTHEDHKTIEKLFDLKALDMEEDSMCFDLLKIPENVI